jgi:hypothetical protein
MLKELYRFFTHAWFLCIKKKQHDVGRSGPFQESADSSQSEITPFSPLKTRHEVLALAEKNPTLLGIILHE